MKAAAAFVAGILVCAYIHTTPLTVLFLSGAMIVLLIICYRHDRAGSILALGVTVFPGISNRHIRT